MWLVGFFIYSIGGWLGVLILICVLGGMCLFMLLWNCFSGGGSFELLFFGILGLLGVMSCMCDGNGWLGVCLMCWCIVLMRNVVFLIV